jgi:subtilisin family serine protease
MKDSPFRYTRSLFVVTIATLLLFSLAKSQDFVPGELIIKFRNDAPDSILNQIILKNDLSSFLSKSSGGLVKTISTIIKQKSFAPSNVVTQPSANGFLADRIIRIRCVDAVTADQVLRSMEASPLVDFAQRNYIYKVDQLPNDSGFTSQWNLDRIGIAQLWQNGFFNQSSPPVRVGVLDTGVDYLHPDLSPRIFINQGETGLDQFGHDKSSNGVDDDGNGFVDDWRGYDFVDSQTPDVGDWSTRDNDAMDENGHGTSVAGIIGAQANNSIGIAGISPVAQIVPLRAFNAAGSGTDADIAAAIVYAADNGVQVLNMSFGDVILSPLLRDVLHYAHEKNVVLVASSGNDGTSKPHYPSDFSDVIAVGSVSQANVRSFFSSYGPSLALVAPGEAIPTTKLGGGYEASFSGTSAAAPHVSAIASLILSADQARRALNDAPLSNDAVRANLLASCNDLGEKGWDNFYGAGLVDAKVLLSPFKENTVEIRSPAVDAQLNDVVVPIVGTATTNQLKSVVVYFGKGDSPTSWVEIANYAGRHFINDTLAIWNTSSLAEGTYIIRLQVNNAQLGEVERRVRVFVSRSNPIVLNFSFKDSVIIQKEYGALAFLRLDRLCSTKLYYRILGSTASFSQMASTGIQLNHSFTLTQNDFSTGAAYDFYLEAVDQSGLKVRFPTVAQQGRDHLTFTFASRRVATTGFTELPLTLPSGFILNRTATVGGKQTVIMNEYDGTGSFGKLKAFQYSSGVFTPIDSLERGWVPRDFRDVFNDGRVSTLVQDHGVTKLFTSDPLKSSLLSNTTFVDSADVWGSMMYDFDGDGKFDLVARTSSQYLVFRNLGENNFQLSARLDNPTKPLPGDVLNQFGPPRSLVGDFSGTGNAEIIFADYDGDVMLYRQVDKQSAPFQFQLAWLDTSDLLETSDYLAAGDFDGDGRMDFAVAGHSNLDFNADREYDPPTWTVRIFSRRANDALNTFSQIWNQTFYGVKAGLSYDNGISSGKVLGSSHDQLFLNLNPYLYIIDYDATSMKFTPVWAHSSVSNSVLVTDFNGNGIPEFGFNSDGKTKFFERTSGSTKPQAPWGLTAIPVSPQAVKLDWNSSVVSGVHNIYRDTVPQPQTMLAIVSGVSFLDTTVVLNRVYWFAVTLTGPAESAPSTSVSTMAHNPARIDSVAQVSLNQISVSLSFPYDQSRISDAAILVDDSLMPASIGFRSPTKILISFGQALAKDTHYVRIRRLVDIYGMNADTTQRMKFYSPLEETAPFYLRQASFVSQSMIMLEYNDTLSSSAVDVSQYRLSNSVKVFSIKDAKLDSVSRKKVTLFLADNQQLTPLGYRIELSASEKIQNIHGQSLNGGRGQSVSLVTEIRNLDNIMVFPNPLRFSTGDGSRDHITFANTPEHCRIDIFAADGSKIVTLERNTPAEGIRWNLNDERGRPVGSGIYIYYATQLDDNSGEIQTKKGKFAVLR